MSRTADAVKPAPARRETAPSVSLNLMPGTLGGHHRSRNGP
jgi:hypothetical protein